MKKSLLYTFRSGKNPKFLYYGINLFRQLIPSLVFRKRRFSLLGELKNRPDKDYIQSRVDYYNKLADGAELPADTPTIADHKMPKKGKVYYFDTFQYTRYYPVSLKWQCLPGDIITVPDYPMVVKSRPLTEHNENSVIMKLDKVRHFTFVDDTINFADKLDKAIFRGKVHGKPIRKQLMEMYFDHPMCDLGDVGRYVDGPKEWHSPKLTIRQHLDYKFILALEGNDVASNLKWIMSSNSVAVMPRPTCETWFMEGTLIPDYHYIEIKEDLSDLEERLKYFIAHEDEALAIIKHANEYVKPFRDEKREDLISLLVLEKYFKKTNQL